MELILFVHLLPNDPFVGRTVQDWFWEYNQFQRQRELRRQMQQDLSLGAKVPTIRMVPVNGEAEFLSAGKPVVLVFIGACTSCASGDLTGWQQMQERWRDRLEIVIVSRDSKKRILEFLQQTKLTLPIVPDPEGILSKAYNAVWVPRIYGVNGAGNLVWLQKDAAAGVDPERIAQMIWKQSRGEAQ
jgi:peroxiredoxin